MAKGQKPDYRVVISDGEKDGKTQFKELGAGWKCAKDGISVVMKDGAKFVLFPNKPKAA